MVVNLGIRLAGLAVLAAMLLIAFAASPTETRAGGPSMGNLEDAGFVCADIAGAMHCFNNLPAGQASVQVMVFDYNGNFQGTELLLRSDLYAGQPCPQEGLDEYSDIGGYHACHHYSH